MKHWLGVMCVGAAFAIAGLITRPNETDSLTTASNDMWAEISTGLLTLGCLLAVIGLIGLASNLTKTQDRQQQP